MKRYRSLFVLALLFCCFLGAHSGAIAQDFQWVRQSYTSSLLVANSVAVDGDGNVIVVGAFMGNLDLDPGIGTFLVSNPNSVGVNTFIQKLDANGNFLWGGSLASPTGNAPQTVAVDGSGGIYIYGSAYLATDYDLGPGIDSLTADPFGNYLMHIDGNGNYLWAKVMARTVCDPNSRSGMALDDQGNIYLAGYLQDSVDLDMGPGVQKVYTHGLSDVFLAKYNGNGNLLWGKALGGPLWDQSNSLAVNASGVYLCGYFTDTVDFDPNASGFSLMDADGAADGFVAHYDANGGFGWAKQLVSDDGHLLRSLALAPNGDLLLSGTFQGTLDADPGAGTQLLSTPIYDIVAARLAPNGDLLWAKQIGSSGNFEDANSIAVDLNGEVYVNIQFATAIDVDPGVGVHTLTPHSTTDDIALLKLNAAGDFVWAAQVGGVEQDIATHAIVDGSGNIYIIGGFAGVVDFAPSFADTALLTAQTVADAFVVKWGQSGFVAAPEAVAAQSPQLQLFPNPATNTVALHAYFPLKHVLLMDALGRLVEEHSQLSGHSLSLDVSSLQPGIYFLRVNAAGILRLVVE